MIERIVHVFFGGRIASVATSLSFLAALCAQRTAAPSPDSGISRSVSQSRAPVAPYSVSWLHVRTDSGVILAAAARPSGAGPFQAVATRNAESCGHLTYRCSYTGE